MTKNFKYKYGEQRKFIDRIKFFALCRELEIFPRYSQNQVNGLNYLLDAWEDSLLKDLRWLAYILATVYWETGRTIQPIKEWGGQKYLRSKRYWPYYGRGYVQLTWKVNYQKMQELYNAEHDTNHNFVRNPDLVLDHKIALWILFEGMTKGRSGIGDFTNKSLENYFNENKTDWVNARRIINGTDKARTIAKIAKNFFDVLRQSEGEKREVTKEEKQKTRSFFRWVKKLLSRLRS